MDAEDSRFWGPATSMLSRSIHVIDQRVYRGMNARLAPYHLSQQQAIIVCFLKEHESKPVYQKDLEHEMGLTNPTVTAMIKSMMANDVVYKIKDKADGRFYQLKLTPHGIELYEPAKAALMSTNAAFEDKLSPAELVELERLLGKVLEEND